MSFDSGRSGGSSGRKFKRSLDSTRLSDPKKQKSQKTLGASWGANSLSSSRSALARKSPFSDFGSYMTVKNNKLHDQFDAQASNSGDRDSGSKNAIFRGVSIFVDGFTVPSSQELRAYMLRYGGKYENYFSRHRVTHIICSNLPNSKLKNIRSFSRGLPVVKPTWVLDSVSANKLLSWVPYQLDQLINKQPRLTDIFAPKKLPVSEKPLIMNTENESMSSKGDLEAEDNLSEVGKPTEYAQKNGGGSDNKADPSIEQMAIESEDYLDIEVPDTDNSDAEDNKSVKNIEGDNDMDVEVSDSDDSGAEDNNSSAKNIRGDNDLDVEVPDSHESGAEDSNSVKDGAHSSTSSASESSYSLDNQVKNEYQVTKELPGSAASKSYGSHSTLTDPNFVDNYFKNSRLHFIGTWRNRYRKRFPNIPKGINCLGVSQTTTIIHIDMDCFFVSAVIRKDSELKDRPVAVCHSDSPNGTSEISSANYPARDYGIRAGMFVRDAKKLCPHLVIVPYNFEAYVEIADQFYNILHKHCRKVQAVSCDEAFVDTTDLELLDPEILASTIRKEIFDTTGCTASAGIAGNMLLSRLATRNAKPDGQCHILPEKVEKYLDQLPIKVLPGIGHVLGEKLKKQNVETCGELRKISKDSLQKDFGAKTGEMLWSYSRGIDNRPVGMLQECKSVGADVNWGVRFKTPRDSQNFLATLCKEVSLRLQGSGVQGRTFTLKIKKRRKDAKEPTKYMGHGDCENLSHSITIPIATDDVEVLQRIAKQLLGLFNIDVKEIRGVGFQVTKLENADLSKQGPGKYSLRSWLKSPSASKAKQQCNSAVLVKKSFPDCKDSGSGVPYQLRKDSLITGLLDGNLHSAEPSSSSNSSPPPLSDLDFKVIDCLPPEIVSELNGIYGGKLVEFVAKSKSKGKGKMGEGERHRSSHSNHQEKLSKKDKGEQEKFCKKMPSLNVADLHKTNIMPMSLSQVDKSVLEQLPPELREDILNQLPEHSKRGSSSKTSFQPISEHPPEAADVYVENYLPINDSVSDYDLWVGSPPKWIDEFSKSSCVVLNLLATMYFKLGLAGNLSSILRCAIMECQHLRDEGYEGRTESLQRFSEVLRQYVKLKIKNDIEEIYVCFRLLHRFKLKSKFLSHVYDDVFPDLQSSVIEAYGGNLNLPT